MLSPENNQKVIRAKSISMTPFQIGSKPIIMSELIGIFWLGVQHIILLSSMGEGGERLVNSPPHSTFSLII